MKKNILWLLSPFLGEDDRPSIKRFLVLFFAWQIKVVITMRPWDLYTIYVLLVLVVAIGIMQGMTTYQSLQYFLDPSKITKSTKTSETSETTETTKSKE